MPPKSTTTTTTATTTGGTSASKPQQIKIQTLGPRGRSGGSKSTGGGWSPIKGGVSWSLTPGKK